MIEWTDLAVILPALLGPIIILTASWAWTGRLYRSPHVDRKEKNQKHLVTVIVAIGSLTLGALGWWANDTVRILLWFTAAFMLFFLLPFRVLFTELGIRRRRKTPI